MSDRRSWTRSHERTRRKDESVLKPGSQWRTGRYTPAEDVIVLRTDITRREKAAILQRKVGSISNRRWMLIEYPKLMKVTKVTVAEDVVRRPRRSRDPAVPPANPKLFGDISEVPRGHPVISQGVLPVTGMVCWTVNWGCIFGGKHTSLFGYMQEKQAAAHEAKARELAEAIKASEDGQCLGCHFWDGKLVLKT